MQEMLTIKSDDVIGRSKTYEAIVKGEAIKTPNVPESFRVLVKELQSLSLDVDLIGEEPIPDKEGEVGELATLENANVEEKRVEQEKEKTKA